MRLPADRLSGLLVAGFGLLLLAVVVPAQVETVDYGFVRTGTLPNVLGVLLIALGLVQAVLPPRPQALAAGDAARALGYLALAVVSVTAMTWAGFVFVAPAMVLAVMLLAGERRPLWLLLGAVAVPGVVWLVVVGLLDRTLPG